MLLKLKNDPVGFVLRACYKLLIAPLKYRSGRGYDAQRYWQDRFERYGFSLQGVGDEGLSEAENEKMYEEAGRVFLDLCRSQGIDFPAARVLEIGCGSGFYTRLLAGQGVSRYVGVDITDVFFPELRRRHPDAEFLRMDVTTDSISGEFDLIVMIDVIEHITETDKLHAAFEQVRGALAPGGIFVLAPVSERGRRSLFYVRFWGEDDVRLYFADYQIEASVPFRYSRMLAFKKPQW